MAKARYQVVINGMPFGARVTPSKDRHGNVSYIATVVDATGNTLAQGFGDTPMEACDAAGGK